MAVYINLLREEQQHEIERRRDPFKLGMLAVVFAALAMAGFYFLRAGEVQSLRQKVTDLEATWQKTKPEFERAQARELELQQLFARADALRALMDGRFLWGTFLADLTNIIPAHASLTSFSGSVDASHLNCSLTGNIAGENPRQLAEEIRNTIRRTFDKQLGNVRVEFESLEDDFTLYLIKGKKNSGVKFTISIRADLIKRTGGGNAS